MTEKEKLLEYIDNPVLTGARNSMGCSENWYVIWNFFGFDGTISVTWRYYFTRH